MQDFQRELRRLNTKPFLRRSNVHAAAMLIVNYGLIVVAFVLPGIWLHPVTIVLSLVLLGNRQLGLGILMHDCAHRALFRQAKINDYVGRWLCAAPILAQFDGYRHYHLKHHANAGTVDDPDYPNYRPYPVTRRSLLRKLGRDVVGLTGIKNTAILCMMHAGRIEYDMAYTNKQATEQPSVYHSLTCLAQNLWPAFIFHMGLFSILTVLASPWLYGLWWLAYLTTFQLFSRLRNAAEHANVPDLLDKDPRKHARTVHAGLLARLTVAPNHVNYHLEHHWLPSVPPYRLAAFHSYLRASGVLEGAQILPDYGAVIRQMIRR